jgi:hypothetical protein
MNEDDNQIRINAELQICMKQVQEDIKRILNKLDNLENVFVTRKEFGPVQKIVYSFIGLVMATVVTSVLYLVIKH